MTSQQSKKRSGGFGRIAAAAIAGACILAVVAVVQLAPMSTPAPSANAGLSESAAAADAPVSTYELVDGAFVQGDASGAPSDATESPVSAWAEEQAQEAEPETPYEIVSDDGISAEHQGGVIMVELAEGVDLAALNEDIAGRDWLAEQSLSQADASLGWVALRLSDETPVPDGMDLASQLDTVKSAQPNYVYRLNEIDAPSLQAGAIADAALPDSTAGDGRTYDARDYYDFVNDAQAMNQMALITVRAREAYLYTHDAAHNPKFWNASDQRPAIAVLDTGVDVNHEDLKDNVVDYYDAVAREKSPRYIESHGTHVAGIAAAKTNNELGIVGVSFDAKIVSVKVFKQEKGEVFADSVDILEGYEFVIANADEHNIRVANMSLGSTTTTTDRDDKALLEAVDRAANDKRILTTISAGNSALTEGGAYSDYPSDFSPNSIGVIDCAVTGVQDNAYPVDDAEHAFKAKLWMTRDSYSNFNMQGTANKQISALGSSVMSTVPLGYGDDSGAQRYYGRKNGTSMAAPCVAGIAALALSIEPTLSINELKNLLFTSAVDIADQAGNPDGKNLDPTTDGFDVFTGFGAVDSYNAVVAAHTHTYISGPALMAAGTSSVLSIPAAANATGITWSSDNPAVIDVESQSGAMQAKAGGYAIVSATCTVPAIDLGFLDDSPGSAGAVPAADPDGSPQNAGEATTGTREVTLYTIVQVYDPVITGPDSVQYGQSIDLGLDVTPKNGTWTWTSDNPNVTVAKWADEKTGKVSVTGKKGGETATITATLTSDPKIKATKRVTVTQADISRATVTISPTSFEYDGKAKTPSVTVKLGQATLVKDRDYRVAYSNNVNVGSKATVTVTGAGSYKGAVVRTFSILPDAKGRAHSVQYRTHVQNVGWQGYVRDGATAGTSGRSLRLEGINISLVDKPYAGGIQYRTHVQNIGWQGWVSNGQMAGTSGRSLRLEAIQIQLTGEMSKRYDVYYRVHSQNIGWMGWAKNGAMAGTAGFSYRLEAIQIRIVPKGSAAPGSMSGAFRDPTSSVSGTLGSEAKVLYRTHVQNVGWQNYMRDGESSGTSGRSLRLEGINIKLGGAAGGGGIEYRTHVQNIGWQAWKSNGAMSGTSGRSLRLEAIQIRLTGAAASKYDIYYRVHCQNIGWMGWAKNGAQAGTAGYAYRLEAIQIKLVPRGATPPGSTANSFRQR